MDTNGDLTPKVRVRKFPKGLEVSGFQRAKAVALCHNGEIVVVDTCSGSPLAYILSEMGVHKHTLRSPVSRPQGKLLNLEDVAVTILGHIVVVDQSDTVKLFDVEGKYLYSFKINSNVENTIFDTLCTAVDAENQILVGDFSRQIVTIHDGIDGSLVQKISLLHHSCGRPCYLAVNKKRHIIITDWKSRKVEALDYNGTTIYQFSATINGPGLGKEAQVPAQPRGLVCDENNNTYIVVAEYDKSADHTKVNSGRILKYDCQGQYLGSLVEGLYYPHGIALHNDSLYVANTLSVIKIKCQ